jgi:hypothetical protein
VLVPGTIPSLKSAHHPDQAAELVEVQNDAPPPDAQDVLSTPTVASSAASWTGCGFRAFFTTWENDWMMKYSTYSISTFLQKNELREIPIYRPGNR